MKLTIEEIKKSKVLALSWKEPYGSLMRYGKIETRTWKTNYRGLVLICTSKQPYSHSQILQISAEQVERIHELLINTFPRNLFKNCEFGKAIAIGRLIDCRPMQPEDEEKTFVTYYPDLYCHVYRDVTPIEPFDWKGKQGWSAVPDEIKNKIILTERNKQ